MECCGEIKVNIEDDDFTKRLEGMDRYLHRWIADGGMGKVEKKEQARDGNKKSRDERSESLLGRLISRGILDSPTICNNNYKQSRWLL